jgi:two-component system OmpR family sensor kinase
MTRSPRLSLRARLLAGLIAVTTVFLVIMGTVSAIVISGHLGAQFDDRLLAEVGETPSQLKASPDYALAGVGLGGTVFSYDNGSPYASQLATGLNDMTLAQIRQDVKARRVFPVPGTGLAAVGRRVNLGDGVGGFMVIAEPHSRVADGVRTLIVAELITGCALLAILGVGGRWLIGRGLAPLNQMATTARRITTRGDLTARMPDPGDHAEVGYLADAINTMLDRIQQAFSARLNSEVKVRQFAADASHELRTPLTTIRGYAELYGQGALGPDQLPNAMRRIDEESQRMSRLVAELLELARLDRSSSLNLTQTDLALLVRDAPSGSRAPTGCSSWPTSPGSARCWRTCWPTCVSTPRRKRPSRYGSARPGAGPCWRSPTQVPVWRPRTRRARSTVSIAAPGSRMRAGAIPEAGSGCRSSRPSRPRTTATPI